MSIPTSGEEFAKLMEYLRKAQESAAMLGHLSYAESNPKAKAIGDGWIAVSEMFKRVQYQVTRLATGKLQ